MAREQTSNAAELLRRRYIKDDPQREASLEVERVNAEVARMIYELRIDAGLSQQELADLVGTTQSAVSRLEDADYEGHSLSMLNRISKALQQRLTVVMTAIDPVIQSLRFPFRLFVTNLRKAKGLTPNELAEKLDVDVVEILAMERSESYRPSPLALHKLGEFYGIPTRHLAALAGAVREIPSDLEASASRFAAQSESFAGLTSQERKLLDEFVKCLKQG